MELWTQVIVEWINCLDISEVPIKDIKQLQSEKCYENLINLLPWKNTNAADKNDIVTSFLKDEYPDFTMEKTEQDIDLYNVCIGSLLLLSASQEPVFHKPMCAKLQHDTQIKIKTFLETVLPYGKDVTKEILFKTFARLSNAVPKTPSTTPRTHLLKEFFNTPASRSARSHKRMFEYNRELRHLRTELEMERYEKADMQEDIDIQQKKIENLQKKLHEKSAEIKRLREEQTKSATPQSCKKYKNANNYNDLCRKELRKLEEELRQQRREMNMIEEEKESVLKKLISTERQCMTLKEKCESFESSIESLLIQIEYRDKELIGLKLTNDELRTHLEEYQKINAPDVSCEFDNSLAPSSPSKGEVLSTVVELQLQEAKVESDRLKEQLQSVTSKLKDMAEDNERLTKANGTLQDDVRKMEECIEENKRLKEAAMQNKILENDIAKLRDSVAAKDKLLASLSVLADENARLKEIAAEKSILESDIIKLQETVAAKDELLTSLSVLADENARLKEIAAEKSILESDIIKLQETVAAKDELLTSLSVLADENARLKEIAAEKSILENDIIKLEESVAAKDNALSKYAEENARLRETVAHKSILEQNLIDLRNELAAKDELLATVSLSLNNFVSNVQTKLGHIFDKLDSSVIRVRKLENITNELQRNHEAKMALMNSNIQDLKSERKKVSDLLNEKKVMKEKLDTARTRNAKLERNLDELRDELKKTKAEHGNKSSLPEIECLKQEITLLKKENVSLSEKCENLSKQTDKENLEQEVTRVKEENALLSKKYYDLKKQNDVEKFREEIACLRQEKVQLSKTNDDLRRQLNEIASTDRLQDIHRKYEQKLEEMKIKMKIAHKEQITKLSEAQNSAVQDKLDNLRTQMREQCLRHSEEMNACKVHISDLEKEILHTGNKLLIEQQQKQEVLRQLNELKIKLERLQDATQIKSAVSTQHNVPEHHEFGSSDTPLNSTRTMQVIKEEYCEREYRMHNTPALGNSTFKMMDEKTEVFDNVHLSNLKEGNYLPTHDADRLSILQQRNSLYLPHLKSSYPAEMQFHPTGFNEEEVKPKLNKEDRNSNITGTPGQGIVGIRQRSRVSDRRQMQ